MRAAAYRIDYRYGLQSAGVPAAHRAPPWHRAGQPADSVAAQWRHRYYPFRFLRFNVVDSCDPDPRPTTTALSRSCPACEWSGPGEMQAMQSHRARQYTRCTRRSAACCLCNPSGVAATATGTQPVAQWPCRRCLPSKRVPPCGSARLRDPKRREGPEGPDAGRAGGSVQVSPAETLIPLCK